MPQLYSSPWPASKSLSSSAVSQAASSSTSSRKASAVERMELASSGSLRTGDPAASHSVTRNSMASWRVAASRVGAAAMESIALASAAAFLRRKRASRPASSTSSSSASCAPSSSAELSRSPSSVSMAGTRSSIPRRWAGSSSAHVSDTVACMAARRTGSVCAARHCCSTASERAGRVRGGRGSGVRGPGTPLWSMGRWATSESTMACARRAKMSRLLSRSRSGVAAPCTAANMKGSSSAHSP